MKLVYLATILVVLITFLTTNVETKAIEGRIVSGTPATLGQFPWQVLLKKYTIDTVLCGGSLISDSWVLTAAHCTYGLDSVVMTFGTINATDLSTMRTSTEIYNHPKYNGNDNDIALVKLPTPLTFTKDMQPITLVSSSQADDKFIGTVARIAGYGYTDDEYLDHAEVLLWAKVEIVDNADCVKVFGQNIVKDTILCAKSYGNTNMNICTGDSGGALVATTSDGKALQIGINAFAALDSCTERKPSGYVRLTSYLDFISNITNLTLS